MMLKALVVAGILVTGAGTASADDWATTPDLLIRGYALNAESITRTDDGKAALWALSLPRADQTKVQGKTIVYYLQKIELDCAHETFAIRVAVAYGYGGESVQTENSRLDPQPVVPETIGAEIYRIGCKGAGDELTMFASDSAMAVQRMQQMQDSLHAAMSKK